MEPGELLRAAESIQFFDWNEPEIPASVVRLGKTVYGFEPEKGYLLHSVDADGKLGETPVDEPDHVDLVVCFRPPEEQVGLAQFAVNKGAKGFWVQPPVEASHIARVSTQRARMSFVVDTDIREVASAL